MLYAVVKCTLNNAFLSQVVELWEACQYGLVEHVCYLLTTGVNVNMVTYVSGLLDMRCVASLI